MNLPATNGMVIDMSTDRLVLLTASGIMQLPYRVLPASVLDTMVGVDLNGFPTQMTLAQAIPLVESREARFITSYQY
ncbi:MAG: hypothetical protein ACYCW6_04685 [Candidatus Xenobia bacterium]